MNMCLFIYQQIFVEGTANVLGNGNALMELTFYQGERGNVQRGKYIIL